jgi:hypothetical protein
MTAKNPVGISFFVCISQNNEVRKEKKGEKKTNQSREFNTDLATNQ